MHLFQIPLLTFISLFMLSAEDLHGHVISAVLSPNSYNPHSQDLVIKLALQNSSASPYGINRLGHFTVTVQRNVADTISDVITAGRSTLPHQSILNIPGNDSSQVELTLMFPNCASSDVILAKGDAVEVRHFPARDSTAEISIKDSITFVGTVE